MEKVMNYLTGFLGWLMAIMMAIFPVTIMWYVLTGTNVFNMDVIANLTNLLNDLANGGFIRFVLLVIVMSFFVKK